MLGKPVPDFELRSTAGSFHFTAHRGRKVLLYFDPKDDTPGCSTGCELFGVSRGSLASHARFKAKMKLPFELEFGVMKEKSMYASKVRGIERSTFVIDDEGVLRREWRGVKVPGHVQEVLNFVKAL